MSARSPYRAFVAGFDQLIVDAGRLPPGSAAQPSPVPIADDAPKVLLFSAHPDDECLTGALPLRLRREQAMQVINVAVTLGSKPARRAERWQELVDACTCLDFGLLPTVDGGLERINPRTREEEPRVWRAAVDVIAAILAAEQPEIVFAPHRGDRHPAHVGTHHLVFDALATLPGPAPRWIVETEYWGQLDAPNLMVGSSIDDVADLVAALACHRGEMARSPYHLALPAGMIDSVRRGAELLGEHGTTAPTCRFATLYRIMRRTMDGCIQVCGDRRVFATAADLSELLP